MFLKIGHVFRNQLYRRQDTVYRPTQVKYHDQFNTTYAYISVTAVGEETIGEADVGLQSGASELGQEDVYYKSKNMSENVR